MSNQSPLSAEAFRPTARCRPTSSAAWSGHRIARLPRSTRGPVFPRNIHLDRCARGELLPLLPLLCLRVARPTAQQTSTTPDSRSPRKFHRQRNRRLPCIDCDQRQLRVDSGDLRSTKASTCHPPLKPLHTATSTHAYAFTTPSDTFAFRSLHTPPPPLTAKSTSWRSESGRR